MKHVISELKVKVWDQPNIKIKDIIILYNKKIIFSSLAFLSHKHSTNLLIMYAFVRIANYNLYYYIVKVLHRRFLKS